jgi:CHAT domain-containing protein
VTEVEILQKTHPDLTWLNDTEGTKNNVLKGIREHDWVHFACHGVLNLENPLQSAFLLQDGSLEVADLMKESFHHKQLAYLSACRTAAGSEELPEEAVHLAAGMLMAGFADVVGTLWSIGDDDATFVAEHFYRYLKEECGGDSHFSSYALHYAVGKQRELIKEEQFYRWIPFIHFGV